MKFGVLLLTLSLFGCTANIRQPLVTQKQLAVVNSVQEVASTVHPIWKVAYPLCIVNKRHYTLYNQGPDREWNLVRSGKLGFKAPRELVKAVGLSSEKYGIVCVVDPVVMDSPKECIDIFHEYVHCFQLSNCEKIIKGKMVIGQEGTAEGNRNWESEYPFPYGNDKVAKNYLAMIESAEKGDEAETMRLRAVIYSQLTYREWEYLTWVEFKEGFARYLENHLRAKLGFDPLITCRYLPITKVIFYEGGEQLIDLLVKTDPTLENNLSALWERMINYH